ncbi:MAG: family 43 glycosylhydrolase [Fibrobacteres bacterium]|nr:family 43 glycosylhydrolase [Fibrobacterota bacterium]
MNAMRIWKTSHSFRSFLPSFFRSFFCMALFSFIVTHAAVTSIQSGVAWVDNNGNPVNAHGGGIWFENGKYFFYGEYFSGGNNDFKAIAMYSSTDLANWTWVGKVLPVQAGGELGPQRIGERPHILKCPGTGEYVMFIHSSDLTYQADKECVYATSPTIDGIYTYRGALTNSSGTKIVHSDMSAFQDGGTGYVVTESGYAFKLSPDYHSWVEITLNGASALSGSESPTLFKMNGTYYWLSSSKTGWRSNDNKYATASSIAGPWTDKGLLAPSGELTWNSQSTFVLPVTGSQGTIFMFCGDRWNADDNSKATYVWQPLVIKGAAISMPAFYAAWFLNVKTGMWSADGMPAALRRPRPVRQSFPERARVNLNGRVYRPWVSEFMEPMLWGRR